VNIRQENTRPQSKKTAALCAFVFENNKEPLGLSKLDTKLDFAIKQSIIEIGDKAESISIIHTHNIIPAQKIILAGIGKKNKYSTDTLRNVSGKIAKKIQELKISDFTIILPEDNTFDLKQTVSAIVEGVELSLYSFDQFKKEKSGKIPSLTILSSKKKFKTL